MDASGTRESNQRYYDAFSEGYEKHRGANDPGGYHELLDELEAGFVAKFGPVDRLLEVGCGTGLVLQRLTKVGREAVGVDLSPGMLKHAEARGLTVQQGDATALPFADESFDLTCSFKVLAHIPAIDTALSEMARVTKRGGTIVAEFYNPYSFRGLIKHLGPALATSKQATEAAVYTRFDTPAQAEARAPKGCHYIDSRGVRVVTPTAHFMRPKVLRSLFRGAEQLLCDSPLRRLGGFYLVAWRKE